MNYFIQSFLLMLATTNFEGYDFAENMEKYHCKKDDFPFLDFQLELSISQTHNVNFSIVHVPTVKKPSPVRRVKTISIARSVSE